MPSPFQLRSLFEVPVSELIGLHSEPRVQRHLPLARGAFTEEQSRAFLAQKRALWEAWGFGPSAIWVADRFVGWGGLQKEGSDVDFGLVLHPSAFGLGGALLRHFLAEAFCDLRQASVAIRVPPERLKRVRALVRLGFDRDGEELIEGLRFLRFRLPVEHWRREESLR